MWELATLRLEGTMRSTRWMIACAVGILMLTSNFALAQGHGNGNGNGKGKGHGKRADDDQGEYYQDRDSEAMRGWYDETSAQASAWTCQERSVAPWIGKTTCTARHASTRAPKTPSTLSRRP